MSINLYALSYINEIARTGSISRASENLLLTQPYLSKIVKSVEKELGVTLFRRVSRGVELTEPGRKFVKHAQKILYNVEKLEVMFYEPEETLHVNVSMGRSFSTMHCVTEMINHHADKKRLQVHARETNPFQVIEDVRTRQADFGTLPFFDVQEEFYLQQFKTSGLEHSLYYKRPFWLVMSADNPLNSYSVITPSMLENRIQVVYGDYETPATPFYVVSEVSNAFLSERRLFIYDRAGLMDTLSCCKDTFSWMANIDHISLSRYNLVVRACEGVDLKYNGCFIYHAMDEMSPEARELMDVIRENDSRYLSELPPAQL